MKSTDKIKRSNQYFSQLVDQFERKRIADQLGITTVHLWRLCSRDSTPSKKIIKRLAEWQQVSYQEMEERLYHSPVTLPSIEYPRIREAICNNALFKEQKERVQFAKEITLDELHCITWFYLCRKGLRHLDQPHLCEVLTPDQRQEAQDTMENLPGLQREFQELLGYWWRWDEFYYFQNTSVKGRGLMFVSSLKEFHFREHVRKSCMKAMTYFHPVFREEAQVRHG